MSMSWPLDSSAASTRQRVDAAACLVVVVLVHIAMLSMLPAGRSPLPEAVPPVTVTLLAPPAPPAVVEAPTAPVVKPRQLAPNRPPELPVARTPAPPAPRPPSALPTELPAPAVETEPPASSMSASPASPIPPAAGDAQSRAVDHAEAAPPPLVPAQYDAAYLDNPKPEYPRLARRLGEQGTVLLNVYVNAAGRPEKIELNASSGSPRLDQAARATVAKWKFVPARQGERAVGAWLVVPITFVLEG
jgi:periplasmic protein TonB